jgi:hypothetical protein
VGKPKFDKFIPHVCTLHLHPAICPIPECLIPPLVLHHLQVQVSGLLRVQGNHLGLLPV